MTIIKEFVLGENYGLLLNVFFENTSQEDQSFFEGYKLNLSSGIGSYDKADVRFSGIKLLNDREDKKAKKYKKNKTEKYL